MPSHTSHQSSDLSRPRSRPVRDAPSPRTPHHEPRATRLVEGFQSHDTPRTPHPFPVPYTTATSVFVPGRRSAEAILLADRRTTHHLYVSNSSRTTVSVRQLEDLARTRRCKVSQVAQDYVDKMLTTLGMQGVVNDGIVLECSDLEYTAVDTLARWDRERETFGIDLAERRGRNTIQCEGSGAAWRPPMLLWLHEVVNTANIAALYRSAIYFGVDGIILTDKGTGKIQPSALRASAGAVESLPTLTVANPTSFIKDSKRAGWRFMGAMPPAKRGDSKKVDVTRMDRTIMSGEEARPSVLALGNEDQGLSATVRDGCDVAVTIPAGGERASKAGIDSLNVSVAGTLLFSRLLQRPTTDGKVKLSEAGERGRVF